MSRPIAVTERLPELITLTDSAHVLVWSPARGAWSEAYLLDLTLVDEPPDRKWVFVDDRILSDVEVTHWMPMPPAP